MLTVEEAQERILGSCSPINATEEVSLYDALGRVLAEDYRSPINVPPEDNSAMDGYAVNAADLVNNPITLDISQRIPAGSAPQPLQPGTAARIFTGGVLPKGANAVVMQEDCQQSDDGKSVVIFKQVKAGENVRPCGQDVAKDVLLFQDGHCLRPQDVGLFASVGIGKLTVRKKPLVALLGTGNELIEPGNKLASGQIYNSNKFMLATMLKKLGCEVLLPQEEAIEDSLEATIHALKNLIGKADLVLSTGGVSVGEEDYIKPAIEKLGTIENWKIKLKPGKPLVFGNLQETKLIGLPGNPVSSFVTFLLFVAPLLRKLQGLQTLQAEATELPLAFDLTRPRHRPEFMRVRIEGDEVHRFDNQSSGVLSSTVWAHALALLPEDRTFARGDRVKVYFLKQLLDQDVT